MGSAAEAVRERIAAVEAFEAIKYGQRAMEAAGGWRGCTAEFAGAGWMIAQFEAGIIEAAIAVGKDDIDERDVTDGAAWMFKARQESGAGACEGGAGCGQGGWHAESDADGDRDGGMSECAAIDAAVRRQVQRARADYRAGLISLAELARVTRWARETIGGE